MVCRDNPVIIDKYILPFFHIQKLYTAGGDCQTELFSIQISYCDVKLSLL